MSCRSGALHAAPVLHHLRSAVAKAKDDPFAGELLQVPGSGCAHQRCAAAPIGGIRPERDPLGGPDERRHHYRRSAVELAVTRGFEVGALTADGYVGGTPVPLGPVTTVEDRQWSIRTKRPPPIVHDMLLDVLHQHLSTARNIR